MLGTFGVLFAMGAGMAVADPGGGNANGQDDGARGNSAEHAQSSDHQSTGTSGTSGDPTQPQPPSNADDNGTGANTTGPYDSTRDGSPSENGNGDGNATGQPCAGCVGKADNKNPAGQLPGPQDGNNGYECDGNSGIAKTNPAHTGCATSTSTEPPCDDTVEVCEPTDNPTEPRDEPTVLPNVLEREPSAPAATALPRTGSDIANPVACAAVALISGAMLLATGRRLQRRETGARATS